MPLVPVAWYSHLFDTCCYLHFEFGLTHHNTICPVLFFSHQTWNMTGLEASHSTAHPQALMKEINTSAVYTLRLKLILNNRLRLRIQGTEQISRSMNVVKEELSLKTNWLLVSTIAPLWPSKQWWTFSRASVEADVRINWIAFTAFGRVRWLILLIHRSC